MNKVITYAKSIVVPLLIGGLVGVITSKYIDYNLVGHRQVFCFQLYGLFFIF